MASNPAEKISIVPIVTDDRALADFLTTLDTYVSAGTFNVRLFKTKSVDVKAVTNDLKVKILGSRDDGVTFPFTEVAEFVLTAGVIFTNHVITTYYTHLDIQVAPNAGGAHGTLSTNIAMASF